MVKGGGRSPLLRGKKNPGLLWRGRGVPIAPVTPKRNKDPLPPCVGKREAEYLAAGEKVPYGKETNLGSFLQWGFVFRGGKREPEWGKGPLLTEKSIVP